MAGAGACREGAGAQHVGQLCAAERCQRPACSPLRRTEHRCTLWSSLGTCLLKSPQQWSALAPTVLGGCCTLHSLLWLRTMCWLTSLQEALGSRRLCCQLRTPAHRRHAEALSGASGWRIAPHLVTAAAQPKASALTGCIQYEHGRIGWQPVCRRLSAKFGILSCQNNQPFLSCNLCLAVIVQPYVSGLLSCDNPCCMKARSIFIAKRPPE